MTKKENWLWRCYCLHLNVNDCLISQDSLWEFIWIILSGPFCFWWKSGKIYLLVFVFLRLSFTPLDLKWLTFPEAVCVEAKWIPTVFNASVSVGVTHCRRRKGLDMCLRWGIGRLHLLEWVRTHTELVYMCSSDGTKGEASLRGSQMPYKSCVTHSMYVIVVFAIEWNAK